MLKCHILRTDIKEEFIVTFAPKLTPREKIGFEVIHISIKKTLHVSSKQNGARF